MLSLERGAIFYVQHLWANVWLDGGITLGSNAYAHRATDPKYSNLFEFEIFRHAFPVEAVHERYNAFNNRVFKSHMRSTGIMSDGPVADCDALLADVEIMSRLRSSNFSVVYYDITWLCPLLIAKHLQIPYIAQSALSSPCTITGSPQWPSYQ